MQPRRTPQPAPSGTASLSDLETPAVLVDLQRVDANLRRAASYAAAHGLALRPHVKTHKSPQMAVAQLQRGARGLTCATPQEAEVMASVCDNLLLAFPPVGAARARRIAALDPTLEVIVALDSEAALREIAADARRAGRRIGVYVELDVGMHRVGLPVVDDAIALAQAAERDSSLAFSGLAFYPGHVREPVDAQRASLDALADALGDAVARFERAGIAPPVVSGGSTPTMWRTHELPSVTEFRPGTYIFNDRTTAEIGACAWADCALTVLATVVSTAVPGQVVIDAGTKALGREPVRGAPGEGYGQLLDHPEILVTRMSEEHGILELGASSWKPGVGERVRIVPNHVCIVVHLHDIVYGIRDDAAVMSWPVAARGRGQRPL